MYPANDNPASCEICIIIRFLRAKNMTSVEIHSELCTVYGQNVMSEGNPRQQSRMFKDGRTNVDDVERSGGPSVVSDDLVQRVDPVQAVEAHRVVRGQGSHIF
jgi:hypothetical protein